MNLDIILQNILNENHTAFFYSPNQNNDEVCYYFCEPTSVLIAKNLNELNYSLRELENKITEGLTGFSLINYEAGYLLEEKLTGLFKNDSEIFKAILFEKVTEISSENLEINFDENDFNKFGVNNFKANISKTDFKKNINKIKDYIEEGDTYQVNYTVKAGFNFEGNVISLFKTLIFNQSASYTAIIHNDDKIIISISPELFIEIDSDRNVTVKPMKGTIKRGKNINEDEIIYKKLAHCDKDKAENLMIVDLLRNDLGRISEYASVKVEKLFEIQKYESLYQMISTIKSRLRKNVTLGEIIKSTFPCGSITGAPKIRTMQIIHELEKEPRGIYTGSIGLHLNNKTIYNVAIRTIEIDMNSGKSSIGLGSGIVWDSDPDEEYKETLLKSNFLTKPNPYFLIFETCLCSNNEISFLEDHLNRLKISSEYFLFNFQLDQIKSHINSELKILDALKNYRVKILLEKNGKIKIEISDAPTIIESAKVIISDNTVDPEEKFQYFKTTNRNLYNLEYAEYNRLGYNEVIYFNKFNYLAEGAITNIFVKINDNWYTPGIGCGILPGVYRNYFIRKNKTVKEENITIDELKNAEKIVLTNSLRGEIEVAEIYSSKGELVFSRKSY